MAGYENVYDESVTEVLPKIDNEIKDGDKIDFLCDYYTHDRQYQDNYMLGDQLVVKGGLEVTNQDMSAEKYSLMYQFTDIYNQKYWTPVVK